MKTSGFLDPVVLARIKNLELVARTVVDGFMSGLHRSPYLGMSLDFAEHRPYMPGDDIRRIDWRLYARTDRHYVKEFEADTNANFSVILDVSKSMDYGTGTVTKLDYARYLSASLAYFSRQQRDRVGLVTFDRDMRDFVPAAAKHLDVVLHTLDRLEPGAEGDLPAALDVVAQSFTRRSILALISDLYHDPSEILHAARHLKGKGNDLIVFHILDPAELDFTFDEAASFQDIETGERLQVIPETQRERYRELIREHSRAIERQLGDHGIDYHLFDTRQPLDFALFHYLSRREQLSRVR